MLTNLDKLYGDLSIDALKEEAKEQYTIYNKYCKKLVAESDWNKLERLHKKLGNVCEHINVINFYLEEKSSESAR